VVTITGTHVGAADRSHLVAGTSTLASASHHDSHSEDGNHDSTEDVEADDDGVGPSEVLILERLRILSCGEKSGLCNAGLDLSIEDIVVVASVSVPVRDSNSNSPEVVISVVIDLVNKGIAQTTSLVVESVLHDCS